MNIPALTPTFPTPKVMWYQTDINVTLRILLTDVDDYFLFVDEDHLRFSTTVRDRPYYLCLYLFGAIVPEKTSHRNVQSEVRVVLSKAHRYVPWLRLCLRREYNPHVVPDPDKLENNEIVFKRYIPREWSDFEEYKKKHGILNILPASHSTDESESDDEMMDALIDDPNIF